MAIRPIIFASSLSRALICSVLCAAAVHAQAPETPPPGSEPPEESADDAEELAPEAEETTPVEEDAAAPEPPPVEAPSEAADEPEAEDEALLDEEDPSRAPPPGRGVVWGVITDTELGEPLIEAPVQVVGRKETTLTDLEGRFRLELPPGRYEIRVSYELHKTQRFAGVIVAAGRLSRLDAKLVPDEGAVEVTDIIEEADKTSLEGTILARQRATVVGDGVGRGEISKGTDRNAAQAAQRVVGATIVGGRFVFVRGLGERYTNALINGIPLPSPEPDRAAVPLDLFPTGVLSSLTIVKTFTPDAPGDFAGGSVRIETREIPDELVFQISARGAVNTNSTFRERLTSRGGDLDFLGLDDGTRALPDGFPKYRLSPGSRKQNGELVTLDERNAAGQQLNSYMSAQRGGTPPDHGLSVVAGNGWNLGGTSKLGVIGSLSYSRGYGVRRNEVLRIFQGAQEGLALQRDYRVTTGNDNVNWGGFGSATYRLSTYHRLSLLGLRSTLTDNRTQYITGYHDSRDQDIHATRLGFVTRGLNLGVLSGEHLFPALNQAELDWNLVLSAATRDEPDRRDTVWGHGRQSASPDYLFTDATESGRHFFSDQVEKQYGGGLDWTQPLSTPDTKLKVGGLVSLRDRNFTSRSMRFRVDRAAQRPDACPAAELDACNDALFVPGNIGTVLVLDENTLPQDSYDANLNVYAGYVMADLPITPQVRLVVGERIEHTYQTIKPYDQFGVQEAPAGARISQTDLLPSLSATWSPTAKTKVRGSITRTLARPQLRELAPFTFQDYFGGRITAGNPDLLVTRITNADARLEYFPNLKDVLAFSVFFKDFRDPIEPVILGGGDEGSLTYRNADGAKLVGVELEARSSLAAFSGALNAFSVATNLTLAHSAIEIRREESVELTNYSRPLVNQAPWVFNLALDYTGEKTNTSARLLYNVVGPRVAQVGSAGLSDVYEHPRSMLDVSVQQRLLEKLSLKLEARNLLNSKVLLTQGCGGDGVFGGTWHFTCSAGDDLAVSSYTEGVSFALSAGYDF